jgi:hypothetical protein
MHWLSLFFYIESKFGPIKKGIKTIAIDWDEIFQKDSHINTFWPQKEWRNSGRVESRTSWRENKKIQMKLSATCNKKVKQHDAKYNAGF